MKILVIHLSDMHFVDYGNFRNQYLDAICGTLQQSILGIDRVLIIVSGDLSFSGKKLQMIQVKKFFNALIQKIKKRYNVSDINVAIVPGNHDVDYELGNTDRSLLETINDEDLYDSTIESEISKQVQFYECAKKYDCFSEKGLICQKRIYYGDKSILLNLINTAVFSAKRDEDQGFHYLSKADIENLSSQMDCDFVFTIMHHPHHFYNYRCKKDLENAIYTRSDLVFVGHEHYESVQKIEEGDSSVLIFAGGELCNKGDWSRSEFHVSVLDLESRQFDTKKYVMNLSACIYVEVENRSIVLSKDRYNKLGLVVRNEYIRDLDSDKYAIADSDQEYFVFPLLKEKYLADDRKKIVKEIDSMESFIRMLDINGKIIISGQSDTGKSILSRAIFEELAKRKVTLFVKGSDVSGKYERTIRNAFEDIYSSDKTAFEMFKQMRPEEVAIVVDDIDYIDASRQIDFIEYIEERFGTIVETCQFDIDMDIDIKDRLKKRATTRDFTFYQIEPFYSDKRKQLVGKIVNLTTKGRDENKKRLIDGLCDVLTKQKFLYSLNPEFIVQFTHYYCNNIGQAMQNDGSVFSKVFEANLANLINPYAKKYTVEKVFIILDKVAYYIYENSVYPISLAQIDSVIRDYNELYNSKMNTSEFMDLLLDAKIMKPFDDKYIFYDRNYLSYFAAREIRRKGVEEQDYTQFNRVINNAHIPINADILLFVTYITDNRRIIQMIMEKGVQAVEKWVEFDLKTTDISFLTKSVEEVIKPIEIGEREKEEEKRVEQEKKEVRSRVVANDATIFNGIDRELELLEELIRGISLMVIIARILPSFEHMMQKPDKDECVKLIYQMPLRIFEVWANEVDGIASELVREIKEYHDWEYRKDKPNFQPIDDSKALDILRVEATFMLLELMNTSIANATRYNSNDYIDAFPYKEKPTYKIEHLMGLRHRDDVDGFVDEACDLIEEKEVLTKNLTRLVTRNYIVNSKRIKPKDMHKLNSKVFDNNLQKNHQQSRLIVERDRNKNKD